MPDNDNYKQDFGMDPIMSLAQLAIEHAKSTNRNVLIMGLGRPTFPIDLTLAESQKSYWNRYLKKSKAAIELVESKNSPIDSAINNVVKRKAAISYGHPQGDAKARKIMAAALSQWYGPEDLQNSKPEDSSDSKREDPIPESLIEEETENFPSMIEEETENFPSMIEEETENFPSMIEEETENFPSIIEEETENFPSILDGELAQDYKKPEDLITADDVLFTVGGAGALYIIFQAINKETPNGLIVTPFPHYSLYVGPDHSNNLFPIHLMDKKGYKLTAEILKESLDAADKKAQQQGTKVSAFLLCDPDNPRGQVLGEDELRKIADVLRDYLKIYPDMKIILDEAYAEMVLTGEKHVSLFQVAPDLKKNIILMRSATKGLSAAGERMAVTIAPDKDMMKRLVNEAVNIWGHPPISSQKAYAKAMKKFANDKNKQNLLASFYREQVGFACQELKKIGAQMPDPDYKPDATFYVLADLSDLFGTPLNKVAQNILIQKIRSRLHLGPKEIINKDKISTDEDICYHLLFQENVFISPLSYFDVPAEKGFVRITCSGGSDEIKEFITRLRFQLHNARLRKQAELETEREKIIEQIKKYSAKKWVLFLEKAEAIFNIPANQEAFSLLKTQNLELEKVLEKVHEAEEIINQIAEYSKVLLQENDDAIKNNFANREEVLLLKIQNLEFKKVLSEAKIRLGKIGESTICDEMAITIQHAYRRYKFLQNMKETKAIITAFEEEEMAYLARAKKYFRSRRSEDFFGSNNGDSPMKKTKSVLSFPSLSRLRSCIKDEDFEKLTTKCEKLFRSDSLKNFLYITHSPIFGTRTNVEKNSTEVDKVVEPPRNGEDGNTEVDNRSFWSRWFPSCF